MRGWEKNSLLALPCFHWASVTDSSVRANASVKGMVMTRRGSQSNAINVRLAAESIKFNQIWLFDWFSIVWINLTIIESIEFSKVFCARFDECSIVPFYYIWLLFHCTRLLFHCIRSSIYENPAYAIFFLLLLLFSLNQNKKKKNKIFFFFKIKEFF